MRDCAEPRAQGSWILNFFWEAGPLELLRVAEEEALAKGESGGRVQLRRLFSAVSPAAEHRR